MSLKRFPFEPESSHPQYLWNEHEYIVRMLTMNKIGANIYENGNNATINFAPNNSMSIIAWGSSEIITSSSYTFPTTSTGFIYLTFSENNLISGNSGNLSTVVQDEPEWNSMLHGWYHRNRGRAIVFIDSSLQPGERCVLMDSFNSLYEWKHRVPVNGGVLAFPEPPAGEIQYHRLRKGRYRFIIQGGQGGGGGDALLNDMQPGSGSTYTNYWELMPGGKGGTAPILTETLVLLEDLMITVLRGVDGGKGANARGYHWWTTSGTVQHRFYGRGAGGGASGQDTYVLIGDTFFLRSIGGAGGGGSAANLKSVLSRNYGFHATGPGGGGAGSGSANNGGLGAFPDGNAIGSWFNAGGTMYWVPGNPEKFRAMGGDSYYGGSGGEGWNGIRESYEPTYPNDLVYTGELWKKGGNGQDRALEGTEVRNGGDAQAGSINENSISTIGTGGRATTDSSYSQLKVYYYD